ncbi:3-methylfumaryl-CoA hydratase [Roseovarius nanhaiticus]|uniref:3-methylfumaryl-CoA hydratase n=1 Tax=Roseovarius nanhaiticus TaxID=573024 RepID=A0A1N7H1I6_9RHOB|nr:MaoC family dehydratase N-terminal domain-containing protein [Roseovarius nanhaiticus]SEL16423.1 3-methylfumaryl-CoA hydratase [Roseovarius nanhaiticus]SIS18683.1 3-methylfumaryl-CoA hydratase [Roseovarius nanhaiticus]
MSDFSDWIGRSTTRTDPVAPRLLAEFRATLDGVLAPLDVPPGVEFCLAPDICAPDLLGRDGHPRTGLYLPDLPLPRRMWAGGRIMRHAPLAEGDVVTRVSTIEDVTFKTGRSGQLGFVTVRHLYKTEGETRIDERQDIVYREDPAPGAPAPILPEADPWPEATAWDVTTTPTLLFRYSALTFNGHRIHYDAPYARAVEGYDGLVVHGPMQAIWMQNLASTVMGHAPARFDYRGTAPLICGEPVRVEAISEPTGLALRVRRLSNNTITMQARATA